MLSDTQVQTYETDGFVVPDLRMPEEALADIRERHSRLIAKHPEFTDYCPALLDKDDGFVLYARMPEILEMVEQLIGPDIALWNMSFFAKPALKGTTTPWHQDGEYWPIRPLATCTVWLAVDASTLENGCLKMMPGSHLDQRLRPHNQNDGPGLALNQEIAATEYDEEKAVPVILEAGQMSLHDVYLVHGSDPNRSPNPRRGITMRFMPTSSVFDRNIAAEMSAAKGLVNHEERPVYLMSGKDLSGSNSFVNA